MMGSISNLFIDPLFLDGEALMKLIDRAMSWWVDYYFTHYPQNIPSKNALSRCKIVSHRGEHDNISVFENTFDAFDKAVNAGAWGIECDVRWTADFCPVIFHDADCRRIFGSGDYISQMTITEIYLRYPMICTLTDLVERYGKKIHLMIEVKKEYYPNPDFQTQRLGEILSHLLPDEDYHFLSLDPEMFDYISFIDDSICLPVAEKNTDHISNVALSQGYGGLMGHYMLLNDKILKRHHSKDQKIGTGFISSRNALYREINRGVEWIFSNDAERLQKWISLLNMEV